MPGDVRRFAGRLPYASELMGVYQPLLGWKGSQAARRVGREQARLTRDVVQSVLEDARAWSYMRGEPGPVRLDDPVAAVRGTNWLDGPVADGLVEAVSAFVEKNGRAPAGQEWAGVVQRANPAAVLGSLAKHVQEEGVPLEDLGVVVYSRERLPAARLRALGARTVRGTGLSIAPLTTRALNVTDGVDQQDQVTRQAVVAGLVDYLAKNQPALLSSLFAERYGNRLAQLQFVDPLASFDPETQQAILSPVGLVHVYRQYFFEFDTFLGPPVGHVWVSPGGTLELFEVHTRRTVEERQVEIGTEVISRAETGVVEQDEISSAISEQNGRNTNVGISASSGVNFGVVQSSASVNTGLQSTHTTAEQTAHKQSRQQSETVSNEIRKNFKVTFKTSVEVDEQSSRRYVLSNTTDKLVNYELRRKMRQVGIQLQHIGTQLCWQVYVDEPGHDLGIAELVHVAQPSDTESSIQPPDAPAQLAPKDTEVTLPFAYEVLSGPEDHGTPYHEGVGQVFLFESRIRWYRDYDAVPPGPGYTLASVVEVSAVDPVDPEQDAPEVSARYEVRGPRRLRIYLRQVNFRGQNTIRFTLNLIWNPPDQSAAEEKYKQALADFTEKERRLAHGQYVKLVKDRVKLASGIARRPSPDLRDEERTVVFRRVIGQLTHVDEDTSLHVTSELIRAIFDVDSLLYFVAPDWWRPRRRYHQQVGQPRGAMPVSAGDAPGTLQESDVNTLTNSDVVTWGGAAAKRPNNYLITEDSQPAPLGSSLGWLLQLDGDEHRNAFLNSPWVKAVIPIRPGREQAALRWLELAHVEGADGLDQPYAGTEPQLRGKTVREVLLTLAGEVAQLNTDPANLLSSETVFENGFDPVQGFRVDAGPFEVFDQWVEVLPTDQVVAVDYTVPPDE